MNKTFIFMSLVILVSCTENASVKEKSRGRDMFVVKPAKIEAEPELKNENLTLEDALYITWYSHPEMKRAKHLIESAHGQKIQAGLWPNPSMGFAYKDKTNIKMGIEVSLSQKFELGGKRNARLKNAEAAVFLREAELAGVWAAVKSDIKEAFALLAYFKTVKFIQQGIVSIDREVSTLLDDLLAAGKITEGKSLKASEQVQLSLNVLREFESLTKDAQNQVCIAMGLPLEKKAVSYDAHIESKSLLEEDFPTLLLLADKNSPLLRTARLRTAVRIAEGRLVEARKWSDLTLKGGAMRMMAETGGDVNEVMLGVSFELPLWNRSQGDIEAAGFRARASKEAEFSAGLKIAAKVSKLFNLRKRLLKIKLSFSDTIIPSAGKRVTLAEDSLENGKSSRFELLKQKREFAVLLMEYNRVRLMLATASIQMERIIPPEEIIKTDD